MEDEGEGEDREEAAVKKKSSHKKRDKGERSKRKKQKGKLQEPSTSLVEIGQEEEVESKTEDGSEFGCNVASGCGLCTYNMFSVKYSVVIIIVSVRYCPGMPTHSVCSTYIHI